MADVRWPPEPEDVAEALTVVGRLKNSRWHCRYRLVEAVQRHGVLNTKRLAKDTELWIARVEALLSQWKSQGATGLLRWGRPDALTEDLLSKIRGLVERKELTSKEQLRDWLRKKENGGLVLCSPVLKKYWERCGGGNAPKNAQSGAQVLGKHHVAPWTSDQLKCLQELASVPAWKERCTLMIRCAEGKITVTEAATMAGVKVRCFQGWILDAQNQVLSERNKKDIWFQEAFKWCDKFWKSRQRCPTAREVIAKQKGLDKLPLNPRQAYHLLTRWRAARNREARSYALRRKREK